MRAALDDRVAAPARRPPRRAPARPVPPPPAAPLGRAQAAHGAALATTRLSSSLTRRIVVLNLGGLVALLVLFLYINQFREGLIDARVQSLQTQGEIIAAAIAASASVDDANITVDPEKLLQATPAAGQRRGQAPADDDAAAFEFSINPDRVGPVLRRLVTPTGTRARIYDSGGVRVVDTRAMALPGARSRGRARGGPALARARLARAPAPLRPARRPAPTTGDEGRRRRRAARGRRRAEAARRAGSCASTPAARPSCRWRCRSSTPARCSGALLLSTQPGDIDKIIASDRWALFRVFLVAAVVMFVLSLFLAGTIAGPIRRLAEAAERVRRGVDSREEIPDFTARADEIGHLSRALRDMTQALYSRMEATESFAADVAHELKNPLTSLRSAVETLPRIKAEESRGRLTAIIQHDIRRLDRLISDISDASRLDAELARNRVAGLDVAALVRTVVTVANEVERDDGVRFALTVALPPPGQDGPGYRVMGHDSRLGQVVNNLLDNARSFSAEDGTVRVAVRPARLDDEDGAGVEVVVDDDGPGIPAHAFERIFERFYTDRPDQGFGQNSGLGLSISRQIIEAHGGRIWAANRVAPAPDPEGGEDGGRAARVRRPLHGLAARRAARCDGARGTPRTPDLHASTAVVGEAGVLIRGASGAGKTRARAGARRARAAAGGFARLVADDRTLVRPARDRLVARPHPPWPGSSSGAGSASSRSSTSPPAWSGSWWTSSTAPAGPHARAGRAALRASPASPCPASPLAAGPPSLDGVALVAAVLCGTSLPAMRVTATLFRLPISPRCTR